MALEGLVLEGLASGVSSVEVVDDRQATSLRFHGSPSFVADGCDLFPSDGEPAVSCRLYKADAKLSGIPALGDLRTAIRGAVAAAQRNRKQ